MEDDTVIRTVHRWVETVVVGLNLCPFAKRELAKDRIRFAVTQSQTEEQLLLALHEELELLSSDSSIETTLLIHPLVLQDFHAYNQFLEDADALLRATDLEGVYQVASFHPDYQFEGTDPDDAENYTNRSPYPMLHVLREESLERAIAEFPDVDEIPARNIQRMNELGRDRLRILLEACFNSAGNGK
jgi:hypothetical protein